MITQIDVDYHLTREKVERARAVAAVDPEVRASHSILAESHARRAAQGVIRLARQAERVVADLAP